ncbi:hypothetical protein PMAYCL1PPCAC_22581 [Pristionchus mayeri]|uniref:Uncharacterized protein n=1 Tax=Pristionchus mayeri TaxID=1317129 RepID=A0AAN5CWN1_9BILA|nr:hypothetical protein PMAYCL1PPCAC_22581 [Pristionchus mayeri]
MNNFVKKYSFIGFALHDIKVDNEFVDGCTNALEGTDVPNISIEDTNFVESLNVEKFHELILSMKPVALEIELSDVHIPPNFDQFFTESFLIAFARPYIERPLLIRLSNHETLSFELLLNSDYDDNEKNRWTASKEFLPILAYFQKFQMYKLMLTPWDLIKLIQIRLDLDVVESEWYFTMTEEFKEWHLISLKDGVIRHIFDT